MTARFEGSFLGDLARLDDDARLECKICWYCYDPAVGDTARQVEPGTPFSALPQDWRCPQCDGERTQFMVLGGRKDAGAAAAPAALATPAEAATGDTGAVRRLVESFREIQAIGMKDSPFNNLSLHVEAVGFVPWEGGQLGILVAPWLMNLVVIPGPDDDAQRLRPGDKRVYAFPSGEYEFIFNTRVPVGAFLACSLFSDMSEFASQAYATEVARAAMQALFDPAHRADTDRHAEIVALSQRSPPAPGLESRRDFLTGRRSHTTDDTNVATTSAPPPAPGAPSDSASGNEDKPS